MDIHDRVSERQTRISKLETHLQRLVSMADPSLQPVMRVMLELDATRGQETAILQQCPPVPANNSVPVATIDLAGLRG